MPTCDRTFTKPVSAGTWQVGEGAGIHPYWEFTLYRESLTLCDRDEAGLVAVSGQILMAANRHQTIANGTFPARPVERLSKQPE